MTFVVVTWIVDELDDIVIVLFNSLLLVPTLFSKFCVVILPFESEF